MRWYAAFKDCGSSARSGRWMRMKFEKNNKTDNKKSMTATFVLLLTFFLVSQAVKKTRASCWIYNGSITTTRRTTMTRTTRTIFSAPPTSFQIDNLTDVADPFVFSFHQRQRKHPEPVCVPSGLIGKPLYIFFFHRAPRKSWCNLLLGRAAEG